MTIYAETGVVDMASRVSFKARAERAVSPGSVVQVDTAGLSFNMAAPEHALRSIFNAAR